MSRPDGVNREEARPPSQASASPRVSVPSFSAFLSSSRVSSSEGVDERETPRHGQRATVRLASPQQCQAESVKSRSAVHSSRSRRGSYASSFTVAAADARSCAGRISPLLSVSGPALSAGARLAPAPTRSPIGRTPVKSRRAETLEGQDISPSTASQPLQQALRPRVNVFRTPPRSGVLYRRDVAPRAGSPAPLASCATAAPERVSAASTSPPPPASPAATCVQEACPCDASVPLSSRDLQVSLSTPPSPHTHSGGEVRGCDLNLVADSSTDSHGSARSLRPNTPIPMPLSRYRSRMAALLPAQQLLENGFYLASDESANSSFSETPRSVRRISPCSSSSAFTTAQRLDLNSSTAAGEGQTAAAETGASPRGIPNLCDGRDQNIHRQRSGSVGSSDAELEAEKDVGTFDEGDEEQAVLTYMDAGAEGSHSGRPSSLNLAPPPPLLTRRESSSVAGVGDRLISDPEAFHVSVEVGDTELDIGEYPPSCVSASSPPHLHRRGASSQRNAACSVRCLAAADRHAVVPTHRPASSGKANVAPSGAVPASPGKPATVTAAPVTPSRQHSAANASASFRHSLPTTGAGHAPRVATCAPQAVSHLARLHSPPLSEEELRERDCRQLSLYEAFFTNQNRNAWLVDDHVLAKVLEYVRIMGYEHPALKRDRTKGQPSLWSSSSAIASPIVSGKPKKRTTAPLPFAAGARSANSKAPLSAHVSSSSAAADAVAEALAQSDVAETPIALPAAAAPSAPVATQCFLKTGKPRCAGQYVKTSTATAAAHLFLTFSEAMRWIAEQEYVIGTVLLCCARFVGDAAADGATISGDGGADTAAWQPRRVLLQRRKPCIPLRIHPIQFVASLVCSRFPQWGGMPTFIRAWETQIHLVLGSASPSHQRLFKSSDDSLLLSSDCEGGNLHRVERAAEPYSFLIWLEPDQGSDKRIWFRFSVTGAKEGRTLRFRLMNASPHAKLYRQNGMVPVWRDGLSQPNWGPVDACSFRATNRDLDGEVSFSVTARNSTETIQIAFCAPYTYADLLCHVCHWHALVKSSGCDMRFEERVLCRSPEGRKLHLLIVTSRVGGVLSPTAIEKAKSTANAMATGRRERACQGGDRSGKAVSSPPSGWTSPGVTSPTTTIPPGKGRGGAAKEAVRGPYANFASGKKVVLVSGRVHPGEVTASHGVHGLISFLLSSDARAVQLRDHFIFFIVPMLNPDGVSRGYSRMDQFGNNLNRCYNNPDAETQPTVLALQRVFEHLQHTYRERFIMYLDFHSHASQSSGFIFGNNLPVSVQHWNLFFPRLVELHARPVFSFGLCRFGRVHMTSKEGTSRVLFGSSLIHSYTVELPHFTDRRLYADDYTAMNDGSSVLFEVTWPPLHQSSGKPGGADEKADGAQAAANGAAEGSDGLTPPRARAATPTAGARGAGKRPSPPSAGRGRTRRANSEGTAARIRGGSLSRQSGGVAARGGGHAKPAGAGDHCRGQTSASQAGGWRTGLFLQPISTPTILCQSAEVGQACLLALHDYCSIGAHPSPELTMCGGMESVLRDSKRQAKSDSSRKCKKPQSAVTYAGMNPIYKQY
ncbi:hypothetical protein LSCM1_00434 [Leishmania martiniquensis]|uniref:Peptidase M14 domain-containing protein n=1 Tax=Leishmania martiniquensis TaxID=1580590 RepID=A0A836GI11_9TRYP|nr:hypothetical protein LSCM1_00434 [Leishmania martiniquensis]